MRGSTIFRIFAAIVMLAILVGAGVMIFQAGQAQGYALGLANSGKELAPQVPGPAPYFAPYYYGRPYFGFWPHLFFFPLGLFFFGLLFLFLIGGIFRRRWWGRWGQYGPGPYGQPGGPQNPPPGGTGTQQS
jgi:hypothetical protein